MTSSAEVCAFPRSTPETTGATLDALRSIARAAQNFAGELAGHFAFADYRDAVDEDVVHSNGELVGVFEGGLVGDRGRVKDDYISGHAFLQDAAVGETHALRWQGGE